LGIYSRPYFSFLDKRKVTEASVAKENQEFLIAAANRLASLKQ
jgi:hypothetical protein